MIILIIDIHRAPFVVRLHFFRMHILYPTVKSTSNAWTQKLNPVNVERAPTIYCSEPEKPLRHKNKRKANSRRNPLRRTSRINGSSSSKEPDMCSYWQAVWSDPSYCQSLSPQSCQNENANPLQPQQCPTQPRQRNHHFDEPSSCLQTEKLVENQLAYYFSRDNLLKDVHLRSMFDRKDGTVALAELLKFAKLKSLLGEDIELLVQIARKCTFVELIEDLANVEKCRVRTHDWLFWVLEMASKTT